MTNRKNIFAIIGSASENSANQKLIDNFRRLTQNDFHVTVFPALALLPHFNPELSITNPPVSVLEFRASVAAADGVVICTPEYVFSLPSGLKNALEWCVATTVFGGKPTGLITASAHGQKGHEELKLVMKTLQAKFSDETTLLIQGIRGKISETGDVKDPQATDGLQKFALAFKRLVNAE